MKSQLILLKKTIFWSDRVYEEAIEQRSLLLKKDMKIQPKLINRLIVFKEHSRI